MRVTRDPSPVHVGTTNLHITGHAGAVLLRQAAKAVGLLQAIDQHLRLKKRARGLSEAQFVLGMAEAVALGADCLDDLAVARADPVQEKLRGFAIPAPQTGGSFLRRFSLGHIRQLDKALRGVHRPPFELLGVGKDDRVTLTSTPRTSAPTPPSARAPIPRGRSATRCIRCCASWRGSGSACTPPFAGEEPTPPAASCGSSRSA